MAVWMERAVNVFVGASVLMLLVRYRDRGILKRIGESKLRFRTWVMDKAK